LWYAWKLGLSLGEIGHADEEIEEEMEEEARDEALQVADLDRAKAWVRQMEREGDG
ncbi:MAG: hypothetical protein GWN82_23075, partial [Gemmatimonadetes bacterium]|nr:hypothetical protein [Gemmatimonadota bacterium]NIU33473.1 hypothetical protein [Gemmatimonadota bacterium]NIU73928.1 hypothetical protein [Gammaproteobacteria bacterium]NIX44001.1 hypothetical protein [Gemmatimonadota bacterium]NIY08209.1 hypothetical protein [Gemmatimonadota bacterium]